MRPGMEVRTMKKRVNETIVETKTETMVEMIDRKIYTDGVKKNRGQVKGCPVVLFLVVVLFFTGWGQVLGAEFGLRLGTQRLDSDSQALRPKVGLYYAFSLGKGGRFLLQSEIYYSSFRFEYAGTTYEGSSAANKQTRYFDDLRYIEVPVVIKYRLPQLGDVQPVIILGGYAAFRLSEGQPEYDFSERNPEYWSVFIAPLIREYAGIESGLVVGLGVEHVGSKTRLCFDVRFNIGLTDLASVKNSTLINLYGTRLGQDYHQRNHSLSFMIGFGF